MRNYHSVSTNKQHRTTPRNLADTPKLVLDTPENAIHKDIDQGWIIPTTMLRHPPREEKMREMMDEHLEQMPT